MGAWTCKIDGAIGAFFWISPGEAGDFLGPIYPPMFAQFRANARDRASLMGREPSTTSLAWVSIEELGDEQSEAPARVVGRLPDIDSWDHCLNWAEALSERATLSESLEETGVKRGLRL